MVIGSGLIASAFTSFQNDDSVVIFASGVSNSSLVSSAEFSRERSLLEAQFKLSRPIVYFSTVGVFDTSQTDRRYIQHKKEMEELIKESGEPYLIFRLPIVAGKSRNPNTLLNFLYQRVNSGERFELHGKACRYLITIDEIRELLGEIIRERVNWKDTINVCFDKQYTVRELVRAMEGITGKTANYDEVHAGSCYEVDNSEFLELVGGYEQGDLMDLLSPYYEDQ